MKTFFHNHSALFALAGTLALLVVGSHLPSTAAPAGAVTRSAVTLERLGKHTFPVTTSSGKAQQHFDRGLTLAYAFSHHAAEQEFRLSIAADPKCAMAWWGVALVNGPHINFPMVTPENASKAWDALAKATEDVASLTPLEQDLIKALKMRYLYPQPEDRSSLDAAYADAMKRVAETHPKSADAATLHAEALMDLHPWDLWTKDGPQPWTQEIVTVLEHALKLDPDHPGANHLYIHALEASSQPERALPAADRLRGLVPDASHLVHLPAHIYARLGRWADAAQSNRNAEASDAVFRAAYPRPGFYGMYMAHNTHFLAFACMMQGRSEEALQCARKLVKEVPKDFLQEYSAIADGYMIFPSEVLMRFGRWEEMLQEPEPDEAFLLARALWRFTRAVALTSLGRMDEARDEKAAFEKAKSTVPHDRYFGNNPAQSLLAIAELTLAGEMAAKENRLDEAATILRKAAALEDDLAYDEPPDWIQPVRHTLGAVLLRAGHAADAEAVYREDLLKFPENGWSLMGLRDALKKQGKTQEAEAVQHRLDEAWAMADVTPTATCYCQATE